MVPDRLPVLGDHYGRSLEDGTIRLARRDDGAFVVCAHDLELPVAPSSIARFLHDVAGALGHTRLAFLADVLGTAEVAGSREALALLSEVERDDPRVTAEIDKAMARVNGDADALDAIVDAQHYRLARWTIGRLRARLPPVLRHELTHRAAERARGCVRGDARAGDRLGGDGIVDGLRIDHVDGLRDPAAYLGRLRAAVGPDVLLLVEKILTGEEALPEWPVQGTTGYEALATIGRVLVDADGAESLARAVCRVRGNAPIATPRSRGRSVVSCSVPCWPATSSGSPRCSSRSALIAASRARLHRVELREALREI